MAVDQDWTSVYPTAAVFKPASVPLPIRMGYPVKRGVPPPKEGNLELVKVSHMPWVCVNFEHYYSLRLHYSDWNICMGYCFLLLNRIILYLLKYMITN